MGARNTPFLKSSEVKWSILARFADRGGGEEEWERRDIVMKIFPKDRGEIECEPIPSHSSIKRKITQSQVAW